MNRLITRLVRFTQRHAGLVIAATAAITLVFGYFAARIQVNADTSTLIPENPTLAKLLKKYGTESAATTDFLVLFTEASDIFTACKLELFEGVVRGIERIPTVHTGITPFNMISFEKDGSRLVFASMAEGQTAPATEEAAERFRRKITSDPLARNLVVSADGTSLCALFPVDAQDDYAAVLDAARRIIGPLASDLDIHIAGAIPYNRAIMSHLYGDLPLFLGLALLIVFVSYYFSFRTLRSLLLPALVVVLGAVWTVGLMELIGFRLTVVMVMVPPLVLVLGSSYAQHVLNQYYREAQSAGGDRTWIVDSMAHINTTIFLVSITDIFGFASLVSVSLRQLREFGIATSIGIAFCTILALVFLPAALSLLSPPTPAQTDRVVKGVISRFTGSLGRIVIRGRLLILVVSAAILVAFCLSLGFVRYETDFTRYFRYKEAAVDDNRLLVEKYGGFVSINYTLNAPDGRPNYFLDPAVLRKISLFEDELAKDPDIAYIASFTAFLKSMNRTMTGVAEVPETRPLILLLARYMTALSASPVGKNLTGSLFNADASRLTISLRIYDSAKKNLAFEEHTREILGRIEALAMRTVPAEITGEFWGGAISVLYITQMLTQNQLYSIVASIIPVFIIAALVFWSIRYGLMILAPLTFGIALTFIFLWVFSIPLDVVTITFCSIVIGLGVDNAIHLVNEYRRLRALTPEDPEGTVGRSLNVAGRPIVVTTLSIVASLCIFVFSSFRPIVYFGVLIAVALAMTTLGAIVLLPVLLYYDARRKPGRGREGM